MNVINQIFLFCMILHFFMHLYIVRTNTTVPVEKKVKMAHVFRAVLIANIGLAVCVVIAGFFIAPEIHWIQRLLMIYLVYIAAQMSWKHIVITNEYISKGLAATIVIEGDKKAIEDAVRSGLIDVNKPDPRGNFPLQIAAVRGEYEKAELLLANGANVNAAQEGDGVTALWHASAHGNTKMISLLLEHEADPNSRGNEQASLPLIISAALGFDEIVRTLLDHGAHIDAKGAPHDVTALAIAARSGHVKVVRQLLESGAEPNVIDAKGLSPLHHATHVSSPPEAGVQSGLQPGLQPSSQRDATTIEKDHQTVVALLLARGANPNIQSNDGSTPLHFAVAGGHGAMTEMLLQSGSNPLLAYRADMNDGISAVTLAWHSGHHELARALSAFALRRDSDTNRIFMSYRTTDAQFVRFLSEQLTATGVPVWFDEYDIPTDLKEKIATGGENEFKHVIAHAVESSTKAICFTNESYASSPYCRDEASTLTSRVPRRHILNITCPEHGQLYEKVPSISGEPTVHLEEGLAKLKDNDLQRLCAAISRHVGAEFTLPHETPQDSPPSQSFKWLHGVRYTLDLGGWAELQPVKPPLRSSIMQFLPRQNRGMDVKAGIFRKKVDGHLLTLHVIAGIALQAGKRLRFNTAESRPFYLVEVARRFDDYLKSGNIMPKDFGTLVGIHLLHTTDGNAHAAFTHFDTELSQWGRHFVIIVNNPVADKITQELSSRRLDKESLGTELEISIQMHVRNCTFKEFCKVAYLGDRVAASFKML